jgi:DNA repair protein RecO (recombination protein O)
MPIHTSEAIVLRKIDYGEADRIFTFLTSDQGKLSGMAKGVRSMRSRYGSSMELLTHGSLIYFDRQGKNLVSIRQFDILTSFQENRQDLILSSSSQYMAELVFHFVQEKESVPEVFALLLYALHGITHTRDTEAVLRIFEIRLLRLLGFAPRMDGCVHCGSTADYVGFCLKESGLICSSCKGHVSEHVSISQGLLFFWKQAMSMKLEKVDQVGLQGGLNRELKRLNHRYIRHLLGKEVRSFRFLENLQKEGQGLTAASRNDR